MSIKLTSVSIAALSLFLASPALSADPYNRSMKDNAPNEAPASGNRIHWSGFSLGAHGGYGNANHEMKAHGYNDAFDVAATPSACSAGISDSGTYEDENGVVHEVTQTVGVSVSDVASAEDCSELFGGGEGNGLNVSYDPAAPGYTVPASVAEAFIDGINSRGFFGGVNIGADVQRGKLVMGVFGEYNWSGLESAAGVDGLGSFGIEEDNSWIVAARLGYLFGEDDRALLYVLGGYGQTDVSYSSSGGYGKDVTFDGFVAGAGAEYALSQNVSLGLEYQHFFGGKETVFDGPAGGFDRLVVTDEMDTDKVMAKLKVKLGGGLGFPYLAD